MKNNLVKGTLVLTTASLITRLLGFVYRMILSNAIGADGVGLYQLCMSITGIAMAICAGALTTAVSKYVAQSNDRDSLGYLNAGTVLSLLLSAALYFILTNYSAPIAKIMLIGESNANLIKIIAIAIPFAALHGIINGYYYGIQKITVPAISTLCEQIVRVGTMYAYTCFAAKDGQLDVTTAFYSMLAGEITACIYCAANLLLGRKCHFRAKGLLSRVKNLITYSFPLTVNHLLMHILQSAEAVLIPAQLQLWGHTRTSALAEYGILTGMALPFIFLPTIITNAISVQLLPLISKANSNHNDELITRAILNCVKTCLCLGIFCAGFFLTFGKYLGAIMFNNESLVYFIEILSFLCPFLFLTAMMSSILNGLGYSKSTSIHNIIGITLRLAWVIFGIPFLGITGYMYGILMSQIAVCIMHYIKIRKSTYIVNMQLYRYLLKPAFFSFLSLGIAKLAACFFILILPAFWCYVLASLCAVAIFLLSIAKELRALLCHAH